MSYFLSILVLSAAVSASGPETVSAFDASYGGSGIFISVAGAEPRGNGISNLIFDVGGTRVMVGYASNPLPKDDYEPAFDTFASWRGARQALRDEDAYVAFGLLEPVKTYEEAVKGAAAITLIAGALASKLPAIAMIIPNSQLIVSVDSLRAQAAALARSGKPPTNLWVSANPIYVEYEDGKTMPMVISRGLTAFAGREIELESDLFSISDLMGRVSDIAHYLMLNGPVLGDGHTIGYSAKEKFRVRHLAKGAAGIPTLKLTVEALDPSLSEAAP